MTAASDYLENKLLDHVLRQTAGNFSAPGTVFVALFTTANNTNETALEAALEANTSGTDATSKFGYYEVNAGSYARQSITFGNAGASTDGTISSNATVSFPVATANYQSAGSTGNIVTHIAIMDASTSGNVLFFGQLTTSKTVSSGDQFTISSGNLSVSLA
mgnify:FL=1|tara:strand:+ start:107 stop:589 length:483 start_codon:yes stop_codon:yes gene_type:complete